MSDKGIITFYVNRDNFKNFEEQSQLIDLFRKINSELIEEAKKNGYQMMFITTTNEASRVEKIDFDRPFPFIVRNNENEMEHKKEKKETK